MKMEKTYKILNQKHISNSLHSCCFVMGSDDDQIITMEILVGFDLLDQLAVCIDLYDYDDPDYNCSTAVVVDTDDAAAMARRHRIDYMHLPRFIAECMAPWRRIVNANFRQVKACFKDITEALLDERCRFKIERTYGPKEYICC